MLSLWFRTLQPLGSLPGSDAAPTPPQGLALNAAHLGMMCKSLLADLLRA